MMSRECSISNITNHPRVCVCVSRTYAAVQGIRKKDIQEIKGMKNPPPAVKMAVESICTLLGAKFNDWRSILAIIVKDDFVPSIVNFDTDSIT